MMKLAEKLKGKIEEMIGEADKERVWREGFAVVVNGEASLFKNRSEAIDYLKTLTLEELKEAIVYKYNLELENVTTYTFGISLREFLRSKEKGVTD